MSFFEPRFSVERIAGEKVCVCADERSARILESRAKFRGQDVCVTEGGSVCFSTLEEYKRDELVMRPVFFVRINAVGDA